MDRLAVDGFPVFGAFVVAERIEEGFAEGGVGGEGAGLFVVLVLVVLGGCGAVSVVVFVTFGGAVVTIVVAMAMMVFMRTVVVAIMPAIVVRVATGFRS